MGRNKATEKEGILDRINTLMVERFPPPSELEIYACLVALVISLIFVGQFTGILFFFAALLVVLGILRATSALIEYDEAKGERFVYKNISGKSLLIATLVFLIMAIAGRYLRLTLAMSYLAMLEVTQILPREFGKGKL